METGINEELYANYLRALLGGDRSHCHGVVETLLREGAPIAAVYTDLFQRSLYDVGSMWEHHRISVAVEHLATSITEALMALTYPRLFDRPPAGRSAVVACTPNEYHQVGGRMVADILEVNGWDSCFHVDLPVGGRP